MIKPKFDGVHSYARVWVNDNYVRDHHGGFTAWKEATPKPSGLLRPVRILSTADTE